MDDGADLFDLINSADDEGSAADPETDAPETDVAPDDDETPSDAEADVPEGDEPEATDATDDPTDEPQTALEIDWDHPELAAVRAQAEQLNYIKQVIAEQAAINAQQQQIAQQRELSEKLIEFADGDMDRFNQLTGTLARITQPLQQQAAQTEQRATGAEKTLTAFLLAAESIVPAEQMAAVKATFAELMAVEGPQVMQRLAFAEQTNAQKYAPIIAAKDQKIAELERRLTAGARVAGRKASGANRVDSASGGALVGASAKSEDDFFTQLWGE